MPQLVRQDSYQHNAIKLRHIRAFTMLEAVVTIIVLSILSAYIAEKFMGVAPQTQAQALQIMQDILYTQQLSLSGSTCNYQIGFTNASKCYSIFTNSNSTQCSQPVNNGQNCLAEGTITFSGSSPIYFIFDDYGTPYVATSASSSIGNGAIALTASNLVPLTVKINSTSKVVAVSPMTGYVTLQ